MIKAGFIQFNPILGDPNANTNSISKLLDQTAEADLIVIPELANSGYNFESKEQAISLAEKIDSSPFVEFLIEKSRLLNLFIVSGINEIENSKLYNSAVLVGPDGLIGKYRKIHLFMNEFDFFEKGNLGLPVFEIDNYKVGILICFDWIFPEVWRILALKGADIICHPSNLVLPYAQQAVPVHGLINKNYNITANRFGTERGVTFSGQSILSGPDGSTLYRASANKEEIFYTTLVLSKSRNKKITPHNHVMNDRIPTEYRYILK